MEEITHLHRALFSNIRKKRKKAPVIPSDTGKSNAATSPSYTSWFWSSSSSGDKSSSNANSKESKNDLPTNENDIYNTDYEILNNSIKPNINMYDEFVQAIYKKLEEV
jgi:hypothetical protein